jgi:hypothetical protein
MDAPSAAGAVSGLTTTGAATGATEPAQRARDTQPSAVIYVLHFQGRGACGCDWHFPCDAGGHVDLDGLSCAELNRYLYARVAVGHRFTPPHVQACAGH